MKKRCLPLAFAALLAGALGGGSTPLQGEGPNQCYHRPYEPESACSVCMDSCMGAGYLCCKIVVG